MKVINIIEEAKVGGPQIRMVNVAKSIRSSVSTTIVMPKENSAGFGRCCDEGEIPYHAFPISRITKEWSVALRYVLCSGIEVLYLVRFFRNHSAKIVHVSGGSWQFKGVIAGWLTRKKILWHLNDTSMPVFIRIIFRLLSRFADGYIFASERSREYYGGLVDPSKPQFVIPAPVNISDFSPGSELQDTEGDLARWPGKIVVGLIGNISRVKGLETFIRMAAEANRSVENLQFVVAGPVFTNQQKYYDSLRKVVDELGVTNLEFVGGRGDVRPLLRRFDIYVCSSNAESSPISVWEAMAMELPIVSTNVGDVPLYVKEGENGFIASVGDHKALADFVIRFAADGALRKRLGQAARASVVDKLDIKVCAEKHLEAYRAILDKN